MIPFKKSRLYVYFVSLILLHVSFTRTCLFKSSYYTSLYNNEYSFEFNEFKI